MASNKSLFRLITEGVLVGHPIHVMVIHFPIGLWGISLLFDLAWFAGADGDWLLIASRWSLTLGTLFALIAGFTGIIDWLGVRRDHPAQKNILAHMALNIIATGLYILNTFMRFSFADPSALTWLPLMLSIVGYAMVMISGYLGGVIIYDQGIGVGRHRKETVSPEVTLTPDHIAGLSKPAAVPSGFSPVAESAALAEDGTLRVKLDGHEICLIRSAGRVHAVQEYCTHRYGPLSEGALHNGCLECPWHNSCFNLMTGEPVSGPAKVPLKIYPVQEADGVICIKIPEEQPDTASSTQAARSESTSPRPERGPERNWERPEESRKQQEPSRKTPE